MRSRLQLCLPWMLGLAVACSADPPDEGPDADDPAEDAAMLEMEAIVYSLSPRTTPGGALWIRRRGEAPVLIEASTEERAASVCVNPDGTGYAVWEDWHDDDRTRRTQTFAVGEDWVSAHGERPFPSGYNAVGCPLAWSPDAFIVNLTTEATYPSREGTLPYRVSVLDDEWVVEAIEGAVARWELDGDFILERRESEVSRSNIEVVLWHGGVDPKPQVTWSAERSVTARVAGPWWVIGRSSEETPAGWSISVVPTADPGRAPLVLVGTGDPSLEGLDVSFSPSGEYLTIRREFAEDRTHLEVLRLENNSIAERHTILAYGTDPGPVSDGVVSDSGHVLFVGGTQRLYVAPFGDSATVIARTDFDLEHAGLSGRWVDELDAVLVSKRASVGNTYSIHSLEDGESRPLQIDPECSGTSLRGLEWILKCPGRSFARVDLASRSPTLESLEALNPAGGSDANALYRLEWVGLPWYDLIFNNPEGGYVRVMYQSDTGEALTLSEPEAFLLSWTFLPPATYKL